MSADFFEYWGYLAFPAAIALPTIAALFFRTYPTRRALVAVGVPAFASLVFFATLAADGDAWAAGAGVAGRVVAALDIAVVALLTFDWATVAWAGRGLTATRKAESVASAGAASGVELTVENRSQRAVTLEIVDDSNPNADVLAARDDLEALERSNEDDAAREDGARFETRTIPGGQKETLRYRLRWNRRGEYALEFVALRFVGRLGFWSRYRRVPCLTTFRVYPNLRRLASFEMLGRAASQTLLGVRRARTVGQHDEFERLRDYEEGDQYKFIDWKATAKRDKLTTRVSSVEKSANRFGDRRRTDDGEPRKRRFLFRRGPEFDVGLGLLRAETRGRGRLFGFRRRSEALYCAARRNGANERVNLRALRRFSGSG